ncbi:MAG: carboxypeptidase-like regulatory domain-containing protein [Candidatus Solibacter sp.]|nr:carboxypeptidase-like regulatory domain-containing protein [Candidatus Solibacter sp.]
MRNKLCLVALTMGCLPLLSQTLGEITGQVTDASGALIAGAKVAITNVNTNAARSAVTTDSGVYAFPSLQPGMYNVRVEKPGFKSAASNQVEVQVQQTVRLDIALTLGQISESIEVVGTAAQLQSENSTVGTVIENKRIVELPLNGRNYLQLVSLSPNVTTISPSAGQAGSRQGGDRAGQSISVAGQRIMFDHFTLDGVENTDPNFNTYVILPSIDALQEFKVQTGVYPAEFGRNATQINVLTKSVGNSYPGTLFEFLRTDKLDAKNYAFTSRWAGPCASRSCLTARTGCSSWPTTRRSSNGVRCKPPIPCLRPTCRAATSAASPT